MKNLSSPFDLIKRSVNVFSKKENLVFLVKIYSPLAFFSLLSIIESYLPASIINQKSILLTIVIGLVQILYLFVSVFVTASGIIAVGNVVESKELLLKKTYESAWKVYWAFLLLSIVLFLAYLLGFILLIVPGVLFVVWFAFSRFIMVEENLGIKEVLLRSKSLVKGVYWKVLGRLIIFGVFAVVVEMILSVIPYGVGVIVNSLCGGLFLLPLYLLYKEVSV